MSYYGSLAFNLRLRRVPEPKIVEVLREVRALSQESGQEPEQQFGPAATYAEKFPKGTVRSLPTRLAIGCLAIAIAITAVDFILTMTRETHLQVGSVRVIFVLLAIQVVVVIAAIIADHRVPPEFSTASEATR
ncbi:hypothetical protein [Micromonospora sp. NPDC048843]|uniref:hypothetical protein n=1 Tax=Micromonospora sp. NPDC048843 TaxID=3155389 RepID=UPI0034061980